ncbi:MAG: hypothetical protein HY816_08015 [Candidatus Wallbacteria bacterium]|nr:hypothetical protein [Candidatus Wallbacteria bacterium]
MSSLRQVQIPFEHLVAEVAALPFSGDAAFAQALTVLDSEVRGATAKTWRECENRVLRAFPNLSIDQLLAVRDLLWFGQKATPGIARAKPDSVAMGAYLRHLATLYLEAHCPATRPKEWLMPGTDLSTDADTSPSQGRRNWKWLRYSLPPEMLLAALGPADRSPLAVELLSPNLALSLEEEGFAELHQHLGASFDFPSIWVGALLAVGHWKFKPGDLASPGAETGEGHTLGQWLLRASLVRRLLALYLWGLERGTVPQAFGGLHDVHSPQDPAPPPEELVPPKPPSPTFLRSVVYGNWPRKFGWRAVEVISRALKQLARGELPSKGPSFSEIRDVYGRLSCLPAFNMALRRPEAAIRHGDPISDLFPCPLGGDPSTECQFVSRALRHLETSRDPDDLFARLFWQVQRVRVKLYRHLIQRPMTPGLLWFVRTYERIRPLRRSLPMRPRVAEAARLSGLGRGLRSLELRLAPDESTGGMLTDLTDALERITALTPTVHHSPTRYSVRCPHDFEFGVVYHLIRKRWAKVDEGSPRPNWLSTHAEPKSGAGMPQTPPGGGAGSYGYARYYRETRKRVVALANLLLDFPATLALVRGIDVCTDEAGVPTWVLVPLFGHLDAAGQVASQYLEMNQGLKIPALRKTVHAGEDFSHLLSGLRRVDEALKWLHLREGDRLGHGVVLGVDPGSWAKSTGPVALTRLDRLLDLAWEFRLYGGRSFPAPGGRAAFVASELVRLAGEIFGPDPMHPHEIVRLVSDLHTPQRLRALRFPDGPVPTEDELERRLRGQAAGGGLRPGERVRQVDDSLDRYLLLLRSLADPAVFERGRVTELVDPAPEGPALELLQLDLRRRIASLGLVVEINPSSNLVVANLGDLTQHPVWRLNPPIPQDGLPPLRVGIGSDDPLTFATSLPEEYMLMHDALVSSGKLTDQEAGDWVERIRRTSLDSRFTLAGSSLPGKIGTLAASNLRRQMGWLL